ncbi:MAG TPA: D-alanyl-D-alanine carboxypeptidase/D-alanyl-D-alanine-endopeptidase, partial [Methylophilaceae bacterium]|nr:D-alanyl-D-alanine carboxypeptidase/D-alanyl-D-alanine-endopeptidase [Methylophilaceae bacterium]
MLSLIHCRWLLLLPVWLAMSAHAQLPASVADELNKSGVPPENVAVYVQQVDAAQPLVSHLAD